jgi:hypothetical protein
MGRFAGYFALIVAIEALVFAGWLLVKAWYNQRALADSSRRTVLLSVVNVVSIGTLAAVLVYVTAP